ncbi:MAG: TatD family hydrolase [Acidilobaceae archaeon]|nr:TatD family hydrolase [Acidilobaceae archaeon]MCX8165756.1 TatD family hydrolase [Acidilobaceae archaeon]MDW7974181.1 TatD family hydrolase [Sulfolobales archaeon]
MIPVADGHLHSNPVRGIGAEEIAERFRRSGGWFMALVSLPPSSYELDLPTLEAYSKVIEHQVKECKKVRGVKAVCLAGFHPADVDRLIDQHRLDPMSVLLLAYRVLSLVEDRLKRGELHGIGEVGRQHYKTSAARALLSQLILERAMEISRDLGVPVHMHLEQEGEITVHLVDLSAKRVGAREELLVFHHADPKVAKEATARGYAATLHGAPRLMEHAMKSLEPNFVFESDYVDDARRPSAIGPWSLAEQMSQYKEEEKLYKINVDNVVKLYGVEPP